MKDFVPNKENAQDKKDPDPYPVKQYQKISYLVCVVLLLFSFTAQSQTYYSRKNGNWNTANTWSLSPGGPASITTPGPNDHVVVQSGDQVTFPLTANYTHMADITIESGATLKFTSNGTATLVGSSNQMEVYGTFDANRDFINRDAQVYIYSGANFSVKDDYIMEGYSVTYLEGNINLTDDIYIRGTTPIITGFGTVTLGSGSTAQLRFFNGASSDQINSNVCILNDGTNPNPVCGTGSGSLPVRLLSMEIADADLYWEVQETEVRGYELLYSSDGVNWDVLAYIPGQGDGSHQYNYMLSKTGYYQVRSDEEVPYASAPIYYQSPQDRERVQIPNPLPAQTWVSLANSAVRSFQIYDLQGRMIREGREQNLSFQLPAGQFLIKMQTEDSFEVKKVWVQ